jgi:hypothetical protein
MRTESPWTRGVPEHDWLPLVLDGNETGHPELGLWYSASSSLSLLVFWMLTLRGVESIGNRLRVLASFWDLRLFLVLLANNHV